MAKKIPPKTRRSSRTKRSAVALAGADAPMIKHFRLVKHAHTGKLIHYRHTSHIALLALLFFVGVFMYATSAVSTVFGQNVTVGLVVNGPPPSVGATITSPVDGFSIVNLNPTEVSGTCEPDTFVVVDNDDVLSSSTICSNDGLFSVSVQLHVGVNKLTARNFDNMNQAGPDTPAVTVTFRTEEPLEEVEKPALPENPVIIPGGTSEIKTCEDYNQEHNLPTGGEPHVAVVCVPRSVEVGTDQAIGILVWGGTPPYALNFAWGSGQSTLLSMDTPGYRTVKLRYASKGIYNINIQLTDKNTKPASGESAVEAVDNTEGAAPSTIGGVIDSILGSAWFETPVPLYITAVTLTLGFWAGDIFDRKFGARKLKKPTRRAS